MTLIQPLLLLKNILNFYFNTLHQYYVFIFLHLVPLVFHLETRWYKFCSPFSFLYSWWTTLFVSFFKWSIFIKSFSCFLYSIFTRSNNFSSFTALKTIEGICFVFVCILFKYNNSLIEMSQILLLMLHFHLFLIIDL